MAELRKVFFHRYPSSFPRAKAGSKKLANSVSDARDEKREVAPNHADHPSALAGGFPDEANTCRDLCRRGVKARNLRHVFFYIEVLFLTVATVVAAVLYGHYYNGFPSIDGDRLQLFLFSLTIVLPLLVPVLQKKESSIPKSQCYREILARIEAEVFKFRTFSSPYQDKTSEASRELRIRLSSFLEILRSELQIDSIAVPVGKVFLGAAPERNLVISAEGSSSHDIEHRVLHEITASGQRDTAKVSLSSLKEKIHSWLRWSDPPTGSESEDDVEEKGEDEQGYSKYRTFAYKPDPDTYLVQFSELPFVSSRSFDEEEQPLMRMDPTPIVAPCGADPTEPVGIATIGRPLTMRTAASLQEEEKGETDQHLVDNGSSPLSPSDYVRIRLLPWIVDYNVYTKNLKFCKLFLEKFMFLMHLSAVGAAALAKQWTVPMLLVLAAALDRIIQVSCIQHRILVAEKAVFDMQKVETWWKELASEKEASALQEFVGDLVLKTEAIIIEASSQE